MFFYFFPFTSASTTPGSARVVMSPIWSFWFSAIRFIVSTSFAVFHRAREYHPVQSARRLLPPGFLRRSQAVLLHRRARSYHFPLTIGNVCQGVALDRKSTRLNSSH